MIIRVDSCNIQVVEKVKKVLDSTKLPLEVKVRRLPNMRFVISVGGDSASVDFKVFEGIFGITLSRSDKAFADHWQEFTDYDTFIRDFEDAEALSA